jgi:glycosyltransferase involved in cell wall biosynthesis
MVDLSVVIPVYGCRDCLTALRERLNASLSEVTSSYELIFVDDRSPDGAWDALVEMAETDGRVRAYRLSRNFGQHLAITAGLEKSRGRWTVVMDCDLQEPPELIPRLYAKAQEGFDIVTTTRTRAGDSRLRRMLGRGYMRLRNVLLETDAGTDDGTLSILSRKAVDGFLSVRDRDREYMLLLHWLGFNRATVEFDRSERYAGKSAYTFGGLVRVALDGLFFQTTVLLRWMVYLGFTVALLGALVAIYYVAVYFSADKPPAGYTSIAVLLLLLTGFVITSLGVVGLYLGRVFEQGKGRPLYIIDSYAGPDAEERELPQIESAGADR